MKISAILAAISCSFVVFGSAVGAENKLPVEIGLSPGQLSGPRSIAYSPDGKLFVTDDGSRSLLIWDTKSRKPIRTLVGHTGDVRSVAVSPDGQRAVSGSDDFNIILWDLATGRALSKFVGHTRGVTSVAFSPDGRLIASTSEDSSVRLWNAESSRLEATAEDAGGRSIAFSPTGATIAAGSFKKIVLLDATRLQLLRKLEGHSSIVWSIAFSPDGTNMASTSDGEVKLWNVRSGALVSSLSGHTKVVMSAKFSADGSTLVTGGYDGTVRLWNTPSSRLLKTLQIGGLVLSTAVSPTDSTVLVGLARPENPFVIWDMNSARQLGTLSGGSLDLNSLSVSPDGRFAASTGGESSVRVWDLRTGRVSRELVDGKVWSLATAFTPDGKNILTGDLDGAIKVWSWPAGEKVGSLIGHKSTVSSIAISPDGKTALSGSYDETVRLWDLQSARTIKSFKWPVIPPPKQSAALKRSLGSLPAWKPNVVRTVGFSPDGKTAFSAGHSDFIRIWDVASAKLTRTLNEVPPQDYTIIGSAAWSADGKALFSAGRSGIKVWDVASGRLIRTYGNAETDAVASSPDGKSLLFSDRTSDLQLADLTSSSSIRKLQGHTSTVWSTAFVDNSRAVSAGDSLIIWNVTSGEIMARGLAFAGGEWLTITPEGFFDASSPAAAQNLNVVRGLDVYSIDQVYQALYRPDLVREKLAGDPKGLVREAAAKLDLNKVIASGAAPRVSILTPAGNVGSDETTLEAEIAEQNGGGIGRIEWRVNGVTLGVDTRGIQRVQEGAGSAAPPSRPPVVVKRTLALEPGENRIEVVAYNGRDLIASDPAQVVLKWDGEKSTTPPKLHVLAVGVNDYYDSRLRLSYAVPDARALGDALKQAGGSLYQSVEVTSVLDDKVTIDNLDQVFADLGTKVHPRDVFVFFLAGHGKTVDGRYHFLPQNFRYEDETSIVRRGIDQERFQAWFAKIPARKSILLYDTCESGSLTGDRVQQRGIERVAALEKMTRAMGRTVLSASSDDAPALEGYRGHGVFTYALLDGLQAADTNGNGLIEVTELAAFVDQKVPDLSYQAFKLRQIPQMKIVGNSFPVASKTSVLQGIDAAATRSEPVPAKPTHVVISASPVEVYAAAARGGAVVQRLAPGTTVTLIEGADGWQLIAKDGKRLGFVEEQALVKMQ